MLRKGYRPVIKTNLLGQISLFNWQNGSHFSGISTVAERPQLSKHCKFRKQKGKKEDVITILTIHKTAFGKKINKMNTKQEA